MTTMAKVCIPLFLFFFNKIHRSAIPQHVYYFINFSGTRSGGY
jgi:hypothetical protein